MGFSVNQEEILVISYRRNIMNSHNVFTFINDKLRKITLISITLLASTSVYADWSILNSGTSNDLKAVDFPVDENTGFVVGNSGTILKTIDAGNSWSVSKSQTNSHLLDVDFIDNFTGYASGINGILLKTYDGGQSWNELSSGTSQHLYSVHFPIDEFTGYAGGAASTLLKTTDGGMSWQPQMIAGGYVYDIVFPVDNLTGYASAIYGTLGFIYKTVDGGNNWFKVLDLEDASLKSMSFPVDSQTGYVANNDTYSQHGIWKTVDGGNSWQLISKGITSVPVAIDFPLNSKFGVVVGFSGNTMKTTDAGVSWAEGNVGVSNTLAALDMVNSSTGYAVGSAGVIIKTGKAGSVAIESIYLHPSSSGSINTFSQMTACSVDWDCVNDQLANMGSGLPAIVNSRDFLADGSGNRVMFGLDDGAILPGEKVLKICISIAATQANGPMASLSYQRLGIDANPVDSSVFWIGSYWYNGMATYCWDKLQWSSVDMDSLEIGVKTQDGKWLQAGQLFLKAYVQKP